MQSRNNEFEHEDNFKAPKATDADNFPPNSRVFIVCGKQIQQQLIHSKFSEFGEIEYCKLIKDKVTGASKGLCFIKYHKTSSAAKAIEEMDSKILGDCSIPLKVEVAHAKGSKNKPIYTDEPEDTPPRSRLFVVCPKEMKESTLHQRFRGMEGLEYTKLIADKLTGESKGFAFVKFSKASFAALAMESIEEDGVIDGLKVKVLIADPKMKSQSNPEFENGMPSSMGIYPFMYSDNPYPLGFNENMNHFMFPHQIPQPYYPCPPYLDNRYFAPPFPPAVIPQLYVKCDTTVTTDQLKELFNGCYGVTSVYLDIDPNTNESLGIGHVSFEDIRTAANAMQTINGCEFPTGCTVECMWENYNIPPMCEGYYPPLMYPMECGPPVSTIEYHADGPISNEKLVGLLQGYGPFKFTVQDDNNKHGTIEFADPSSAWYVKRDLNQKQIDGHTLTIHQV